MENNNSIGYMFLPYIPVDRALITSDGKYTFTTMDGKEHTIKISDDETALISSKNHG